MIEQSVLLSIQPKWVEKILSGEKTVEVRKSRPKLQVPFKCYIYSTQGKPKDLGKIKQETYSNRQKVVAEFICDKVTNIFGNSRFWLDEKIVKSSCLTGDEIRDYANGKEAVYGWHISDLVIYDNPKELNEFSAICKYADTDNDKNCVGCNYFGHESNESIGYDSWCAWDGIKPLKRPPQSWCYVEDIK